LGRNHDPRSTPIWPSASSDGCLKASALYREIAAQGFTGSYGIVRKFVEQYAVNPT